MNTNDFDILMYDQAFYNLIYTKYIFIQKKTFQSLSRPFFYSKKKQTPKKYFHFSYKIIDWWQYHFYFAYIS